MKAAIVRPEGEDFVGVEMDGHLFLFTRLEWSQAARRGNSVLRNREAQKERANETAFAIRPVKQARISGLRLVEARSKP